MTNDDFRETAVTLIERWRRDEKFDLCGLLVEVFRLIYERGYEAGMGERLDLSADARAMRRLYPKEPTA